MTYKTLASAAEAQPEDSSVLATLRSLVPQRHMNIEECKRIAELQANRLRELFEIDGPTFPHEIIMEMPRIKVVFDADLPVSGSAHWNGTNWIIVLNALERPMRQRFSLAHEYKHIIDHTNKYFMYHDSNRDSKARQAEQIADYFAGCLLMPKQHIKSLYYQRIQKPTELAEYFQVSPRAVQFRLQQLKVTDEAERCSRFNLENTYSRQRALAGISV